MKVLVALIAVVLLGALVFTGVQVAGWMYLFAVIIPYLAAATFLSGFIYRVINWAQSPVPFCIPTTCGQQKSLSWIKANNLESPYNTLGVIGRMALEVLFFRSLFRNTKCELKEGPRLVYGGDKWLWLAALAFHWCFLFILIRHGRFFMEPVPMGLIFVQTLDSIFQVSVPAVYITDAIIASALLYLLYRRLINPQVRYISLVSDYFPLFLLLCIVLSGMYMRHIDKVDLKGVKELAMGLVTLKPTVTVGIGWVFYLHLFFVCSLMAYFPFSKLMHMAGVFLSPTRNLANDSRMRRHVNPWNPQVSVHTYEEWEEEFKEKIKGAGLPLERG